MRISINEQNLEHIERKVQTGIYASPDAVLAKALALLDEHDESLKEEIYDVAVRVQDGIDALGDGDYQEYTTETLHLLFDEVKRRGVSGLDTHSG